MHFRSPIKYILFFILGFTLQYLQGQELVINELMSDNDLTIEDAFGDYPDWIEIFNPGDTAIFLGNYFLSDLQSELLKWSLPDLHLEPGGFQLIFASGRDTILHDAHFHSNFKISSEGEQLYLSDLTGRLIHATDSVKLKGDQSYGRDLDGSDQWKVFEHPSPGRSNNSSNALSLSHNRGFHKNPFYLKIDSERDVPVFYTLDGSMPDENSAVFPDSLLISDRNLDANGISMIPTTHPPPLWVIKNWEAPTSLVAKATVIKCRSFEVGTPTSPVYTATYFVDPLGGERYSLPVFSLITDSLGFFDYDSGIYVPGVHAIPDDNWTGNFYMRGDEWEKPVHIEYFEADGSPAFYQEGGVRIHGQFSRRAAQKSLRLFARNEYGKKYFEYPLFPKKETDAYKRIILRSDMGVFTSLFGDGFIAEMLRNLDLEIQDYQPVILFLNGEYWGVHNMREYIDEHYIHSQYPEVHEDSLNMLRLNHQIMEGSNQNYLDLLDFVENNSLDKQENFDHILEQIDYSNFLDYCISEFYLANRDWPGNNIIYWQSQNEGSKWRWILNDLDASFIYPELNMFEHATDPDHPDWPNPPWSTYFIRNMVKNEQFRTDFICRSMELMGTVFHPDSMIRKVAVYRDLFEPEMDEHLLRWNFPESKESWLAYYDSMVVEFAMDRPDFFMDHMTEAFGISREEIPDLCGCCGPDTGTFSGARDRRFDDLLVFPNPNKGSFRVELPVAPLEDAYISVFNLMGQEIYHANLQPAEIRHRLSLPDVSSGLYILRYTSGSTTLSHSVVVQ